MTQINNSTEKFTDLGAIRESPELEEVLNGISPLPSLARPPILFPDLAYKPDTEAPASLAAATRGTIVPTLTAPSLGCSMGLIVTDLKKDELTKERIRTFYRHIQDELGQRFSMLENILVWLGLFTRQLKKYDLTTTEFEDIIKRGAVAALERYNLPTELSGVFDDEGSLFTSEEQKSLSVKKILPRSSYTNGRHDLGYGWKGNHFLEIQYVDRIYNNDVAEQLGLSADQVVIMYHGGGGLVPYHVGRYYANRRKNTLKQKLFQTVGKIIFHFFSVDGIRYARQRFEYYFKKHPFLEIPLNTTEGRRLLAATKASLNYSYAFNVAIYRRVIDAFTKTFGEAIPPPRLAISKIHNAIVEEMLDGKPALVHRHTVTRVNQGEPTVVSGFNTTHSYIVTGDSKVGEYLNSVDHGAGRVHKHLKEKLVEEPHTTTIYRTKEPRETDVRHASSDGIEQVLDLLEKHKIARRAVALRPIATFKG